jgi:hypothetical protein
MSDGGASGGDDGDRVLEALHAALAPPPAEPSEAEREALRGAVRRRFGPPRSARKRGFFRRPTTLLAAAAVLFTTGTAVAVGAGSGLSVKLRTFAHAIGLPVASAEVDRAPSELPAKDKEVPRQRVGPSGSRPGPQDPKDHVEVDPEVLFEGDPRLDALEEQEEDDDGEGDRGTEGGDTGGDGDGEARQRRIKGIDLKDFESKESHGDRGPRKDNEDEDPRDGDEDEDQKGDEEPDENK